MAKNNFLFDVPKRPATMSDNSYVAFKLASIANRLAQENRTLVNHRNGRPENVAEHSLMLAIMGPIVAETIYPDLNPDLIARFASIHDVVEAYVGDTPTHNIDETGFEIKQKLENRGLKKLNLDFNDMPGFVKLINDYEEQKIPEARFVKVLDKCMPILIHIIEGGKTLRTYIDKKGLYQNSRDRSQKLRKQYPDFLDLIIMREELATIASRYLIA